MTDKEKIKFWAKGRLFEIMNGIGENDAKNILTDLLSLIDSMQEEPVSEFLENAAKENAKIEMSDDTEVGYDIKRFGGFVDGANWQKEHLLAKAFDFTQEHNIACILASECLRNHGWFSRERVFNNLFRHLACVDKLFEGKFSGKTKVIVIKED